LRRSQVLKSILCDGGIGPIRRVRMVGLWPRATSYFARNHWAGKIHADDSLVHDSPLNNAFAHFVNLCFFLTGPEMAVSSQVRPTDVKLWRAHSIQTFDTALVRAESREGVTFEFFVSHSCPVTREPEIWDRGDERDGGMASRGPLGVFREGMDSVYRDLPGIVETRRSMFEAALRKLVDPTAFICTTEMAEAHRRLSMLSIGRLRSKIFIRKILNGPPSPTVHILCRWCGGSTSPSSSCWAMEQVAEVSCGSPVFLSN
jgi:hypothetical protein